MPEKENGRKLKSFAYCFAASFVRWYVGRSIFVCEFVSSFLIFKIDVCSMSAAYHQHQQQTAWWARRTPEIFFFVLFFCLLLFGYSDLLLLLLLLVSLCVCVSLSLCAFVHYDLCMRRRNKRSTPQICKDNCHSNKTDEYVRNNGTKHQRIKI